MDGPINGGGGAYNQNSSHVSIIFSGDNKHFMTNFDGSTEFCSLKILYVLPDRTVGKQVEAEK